MYRYRLWGGSSPDPVIEMTINSPSMDHARFVIRNLHMDFFFNDYIPDGRMSNSLSKLEEIDNEDATDIC